MTRQQAMQAFVSPIDSSPLASQNDGLKDRQGHLYQSVTGAPNVIDFIAPFVSNDEDLLNLEAYNSSHSIEIYRNFLEWLFASFEISEDAFRRALIAPLHLKPGMKVLVVGCGLGEDVAYVRQAVGPTGEVHAQDISKAMVIESAKKCDDSTLFSISNARNLPYASNYFDAVVHFGGINLFGDMKQSIAELDRVCKVGGRVVFGDEGVAQHLRDSEYYQVAITNNALWSHEAPMHLLPHSARDIQLNYMLGNCYYLISFTAGEGLPHMNIDVPHKGARGGTARTRYYGQLEGVSPQLKAKVQARAKASDISVHQLLEDLLK